MKIKRNYWTIPGVKEIPMDADYIIRYIEKNTGVKINANTRLREVVEARQLAMYILRKKTKLKTVQIGNKCGGRDHATVIHACKAVDNHLKYNRGFRFMYGEILRNFKLM